MVEPTSPLSSGRKRTCQQETSAKIRIIGTGNFTVVENEIFDMGLSPYEITVFLYLRRVAGVDGGCWITTRKIAETLGIGRRKLNGCIARLIELSMVVQDSAPDHVRNSNARTLTTNRSHLWGSVDPDGIQESEIVDPHGIQPWIPTGSTNGDSWIPTGSATGTLEEEDPKIDQDPDEEDLPTPPPKPTLVCQSTATSCASLDAPDHDSNDDLNLAEEWIRWAKTQQPWLKSTNVNAYAKAISSIRHRHGHTIDQVRAVFLFIQGSDFWSKNAISPTSLLKRSKTNDLYKYENVMSDFQRESRPGGKLFWREIDKSLSEVPF